MDTEPLEFDGYEAGGQEETGALTATAAGAAAGAGTAATGPPPTSGTQTFALTSPSSAPSPADPAYGWYAGNVSTNAGTSAASGTTEPDLMLKALNEARAAVAGSQSQGATLAAIDDLATRRRAELVDERPLPAQLKRAGNRLERAQKELDKAKLAVQHQVDGWNAWTQACHQAFLANQQAHFEALRVLQAEMVNHKEAVAAAKRNTASLAQHAALAEAISPTNSREQSAEHGAGSFAPTLTRTAFAPVPPPMFGDAGPAGQRPGAVPDPGAAGAACPALLREALLGIQHQQHQDQRSHSVKRAAASQPDDPALDGTQVPIISDDEDTPVAGRARTAAALARADVTPTQSSDAGRVGGRSASPAPQWTTGRRHAGSGLLGLPRRTLSHALCRPSAKR